MPRSAGAGGAIAISQLPRADVWRSTRTARLASVRRDPISVEDRVDRAQLRDRRLQRVRVADLDDEAVLDHRVRDDAARLDDVDAGLRERPREVLEQAVAIPAVDLQLDLERGGRVAVPADRHEALRVLAQRGGVRAVLAVDRDAAAERHVAEDLVARDRPAALGQPQRHVLDALHPDAVLGRVALWPAGHLARGDEILGDGRLVLGGLALLQALHQLVDDDLGGDLRAAERDV